jgi:ubiquinone/menaquinone biosynthesis C-methylase UbiE
MDKELEYNRYNKSSAKKIDRLGGTVMPDGSAAYPLYLNTPYLFYESILAENISPGMKVLDLCCGDGIHSLFLARLGADVIAVDIAENSIKLAELRAKKAGISGMRFLVADAEELPFGEGEKFDVITCVGSLSYVDIQPLIDRLLELLKENGKFICVDSFNHNPVYRMNRYIHYLKGERTLSTLNRMPDITTIQILNSRFKSVQVNYFGIFSFLGPVFQKIIGDIKAKKIIDRLDNRMSFLKNQAFKIVLIAKK